MKTVLKTVALSLCISIYRLLPVLAAHTHTPKEMPVVVRTAWQERSSYPCKETVSIYLYMEHAWLCFYKAIPTMHEPQDICYRENRERKRGRGEREREREREREKERKREGERERVREREGGGGFLHMCIFAFRQI